MLMLAMILTRETTLGAIEREIVAVVREHAVDPVNCTRISPASGSQWMSDAPCSTACAISE